MTKVATAVARSLRLLGILDPSEAPEAEDMGTALSALNAMMVRWEANGLAVGWSLVESPSEDLPVPPEAEDAVIYNLAMRLAPEYGVQLRPDVVALAQDGLRALQRDRLVSNPLEMRSRLGIGLRYNMITDQYE